jgi:uncharacterized membrane protein
MLAGCALAASAGLNAYIPLLALAIAGNATSKVDLVRPYGFLGSFGAILIILALLTIELIVDKIPRLDYFNDLVQSIIRPAAGALALMAITRASDRVNPLVAMIVGLVIAGAVHVYKMMNRPAITEATHGLGNPFVSMIEDALSAVVAILAVLVPFAGAVAAVVSAYLLRSTYRLVRRFGGSRLVARPTTLRR